MNAKSIAMGVVAMVVATVLVVTCAVPIINDSVATEDTFTNEGLFFMEKMDTESEKTVVWDPTDPTNITIDGEKISLPQTSTFPLTLIASDTWGLRYLSGPPVSVTLFDDTASTKTTVTNASENPLEITMSGGTATFVNGTSTYTESFTDGYIISKKGSYVMKNANDTAYLNGDSIIYSTGRSGGLATLSSNTVSVHLEGNIDDGVQVDMVYPGTFTTSNIAVNTSEVNGFIDLYSFSSVTFTVTDESSNTADATYSQVIVPYEVTAERSVHVDGPTGDILAVIPILMVLGIVIGAVALFLTNRRD